MKSNIKFSVIIPAYNQAHLLSEAIDSLLSQTYFNWEAVIVNDGSTDNTADVMSKYEKKDSRIKCYHKVNGGTSSALNYGIERANGQWICWLSSDDLYEPDKFEIMYNDIKSFPNIKFFYTHFYYLNDQTKEKTLPDLWQSIPPDEFQVTKFFAGNYIHGNSFAAHSSVFEKVGMFDETLRQAQDFDMWLRITAKFVSKYINERTCVTRFHPGQDTNAFPDGMYLDSARSCLNFINSYTYEEFYPLLNLTNPEDIKKALRDSLNIAINTNAFMYRSGYIPAFIDRMNEWINNRSPISYRKEIKKSIEKYVSELDKDKIPSRILNALENIYTRDTFKYKPYDYYNETIQYINELISIGERKKAEILDRYLYILFNKRETKSLPFVEKYKTYNPKLYLEENENNFSKLPKVSFYKWELEPITYEGKFQYTLGIKCPACNKRILQKDYITVKEESQKITIVCDTCKKGYYFRDDEIHEYLINMPRPDIDETEGHEIAFIARGLKGKSGGTIIYTKYMQWLAEAGCKITVFCDTPKGNWTDIPGKYVQVENYDEIDLTSFKYVFLYTILDIGKILNKIPPEKIIYVCQAYEGYLYGDNFTTTRTDKALFSSLHKIPFYTIVVSEHLKKLIKDKFNKDSYLINNFVDHKIFSPNNDIIKTGKNILFVGNPLQPLKGLRYVLTALQVFQKTQYRLHNLTLNIAAGILTDEMKKMLDNIKNSFEFQVNVFSELDSKQMADLYNYCDLYICASWYEGFSLSVLESMASGTLVVATKNMGAESFLEDNYNGYLVDYDDVQALINILIKALIGKQINKNIIYNGLNTAAKYSEANSKKSFIEFANKYGILEKFKYSADKTEINVVKGNTVDDKFEIIKKRKKFTITYLVNNLSSISGGNLTIISQANMLAAQGHEVKIISFTDKPRGIYLNAEVIKIPDTESMSKYVNKSDIVIATFYLNAHELLKIKSDIKIYFAQGDQFIFDDVDIKKNLKNNRALKTYKLMSDNSYKLNGVKLIANSEYFARIIQKRTGRIPDAIINVGVDMDLFCPRPKQLEGFTARVLVVGPDSMGTDLEPLRFKGITEVKEAIDRIKKENYKITLVRISNTQPDIFKDYDCEFYYNPAPEVKSFLYATADILIYPSYYESWGLPPLEAMASKTAVICTKTIGISEYCEDKKNCLLINPGSADEIYRATKELLDDVKLRNKIAENGYLTALINSKDREFKNLENILYKFYLDNHPELLNEYSDDEKNVFNSEYVASLLNEKKYDEAIRYTEEYLKTVSSDSKSSGIEDVYDLAGNISLIAGNTLEAQQYFEKELNLNPQSSSACFGLGQVFLAQDNPEAAKVMLEWAVKNDPNNGAAADALADVNKLLGYELNHSSLEAS
ncbi:glycosyltransferase [Melioribacter sp. Ez-97]|uniref:glycosyltransferase n=1 Tax=Melioribacter sp. Ez-97 TaxID=3423434 RepID=UPI003ED8E1AE